MKLSKYIGTLLYQHDCVIIPTFGGFIARYIPATIHPVQNTFAPPSRQIMFNASLLHNDGLLGSHVAREERITFTEALGWIADELEVIQNQLRTGKSVRMEGIGILHLNSEGNIEFSPLTTTNYLEDTFGLTTFVSPQIRRDAAHKSRREGDPKMTITLPSGVRRAAAIALPLLAIGLWSLFNPDRVGQLTSNATSLFPSEFFSSLNRSSIERKIPVYVLSHAHTALPNRVEATNATPLTDVTKVMEKEIVPPNGTAASSAAVPSNKTAQATESRTLPNQHATVEESVSKKNSYRIVCGAFKVKENAEKLVEQLKAKNIEATVTEQNQKRLFLVSSAAGDNIVQSEAKLKEIKAFGIDSAWILRN